MRAVVEGSSPSVPAKVCLLVGSTDAAPLRRRVVTVQCPKLYMRIPNVYYLRALLIVFVLCCVPLTMEWGRKSDLLRYVSV